MQSAHSHTHHHPNIPAPTNRAKAPVPAPGSVSRGSGRMPIFAATACGRAPMSRAPVSVIPFASQLHFLVVCGEFSSEQCFTATETDFVEGCLAQHRLVNTNQLNTSTWEPPGTHLCVFHLDPLPVFFQRTQMRHMLRTR